jgi:hypothetical protein
MAIADIGVGTAFFVDGRWKKKKHRAQVRGAPVRGRCRRRFAVEDYVTSSSGTRFGAQQQLQQNAPERSRCDMLAS